MIISLENQFSVFFLSGHLRKVLLHLDIGIICIGASLTCGTCVANFSDSFSRFKMKSGAFLSRLDETLMSNVCLDFKKKLH